MIGLLALVFALTAPQSTAVPEPPPSGTTEQVDVAVLPPSNPHRVYITDSWGVGGTRIIDGDTARLIGFIHHPPESQIALDPDGHLVIVAESIWTLGNRGKRQDLLTLYDSRTLSIVNEIALPGRIIVGDKPQALAVDADGRYAMIYDMDPANSVHIVDLSMRKAIDTIETPGCALIFPSGGRDFGMLCAEGAAATIRYSNGKPLQARGTAMFDPEADPLFDQADLAPDGSGFMVSYGGLIYPVDMNAAQPLGKPFSLQGSAGLSTASMLPGDIAWRPGGRQVTAFHRASGQLFVLMHTGEIWGQNDPGTELWTLDTRTHAVTRRLPLEHPALNVAVSQDDAPLLFLNGDGTLCILDMASGRQLREISNVGTGPITVAPR